MSEADNICKCCEEIKFIKELQDSVTIPNVKRELKATLTSISKRRGIRGIVGKIDYKSFNLNYCPMCGRKLGDDKR